MSHIIASWNIAFLKPLYNSKINTKTIKYLYFVEFEEYRENTPTKRSNDSKYIKNANSDEKTLDAILHAIPNNVIWNKKRSLIKDAFLILLKFGWNILVGILNIPNINKRNPGIASRK